VLKAITEGFYMAKVVLVTGASSGIGKEIVKKLLLEKMIVYGAARRINEMKDIQSLGAKILPLDLTNEKSIEDLVTKIKKNEGRIDFLINNAGYGLFGAIEDVPLAVARRQFDVNLFGLGRLTQLVLPQMRERKSGIIMNISSVAGKMYSPLGGWYVASKFAVEGLSDCLRLETKPFGIKVIVIEPGTIMTDFDNRAFQSVLEMSGKGAYANLAKGAKELVEKNFKVKRNSDPAFIARRITKILKSRRPKARYSMGYRSKLALTVRRWLPDRFLDKMILKRIDK
jgi:short-subunit dehydrogenase